MIRLTVLLSPLVLWAIYAFVITPVAWLSRLFGRDPLRLKPPARDDSYWEDRPPAPEGGAYLRQY